MISYEEMQEVLAKEFRKPEPYINKAHKKALKRRLGVLNAESIEIIDNRAYFPSLHEYGEC